jgi:aspartokinase/homoserine dehydrogenase 1
VTDSLATDPRPVHIAKFGGTSVGTPERIREVVRLSLSTPSAFRRVVVSSAFGGVTDRLVAAVDAAAARDDTWRTALAEVRTRHTAAVEALAPPGDAAAIHALHDALFGEVADLLHGVSLLRECTPRFRDAVISAGERAAVPVVAAAFRAAGVPAVALDATAFVRTDDRFGEATVDTAETRRLTRAALAAVPEGAVAVVTGFVAATAEGVTTTLGRSGSDYTATILAGALDAAECVIWTDVDGVLSADPRVVADAFSLPRLSYEEAAELAHFGAKVLHPRTMRPLVAGGIPLRIANTLNPTAEGTCVGPAEPGEARIRAVTAIRAVAFVRVVGASVLEVPDLASRVFAALAEASVPVFLVAQASAEGTLGMAVREADAPLAVRTLERALARETERGDVLGVTCEGGAAVVAAVGTQGHGAPGLAGRMFATLGRARVNVRALAQGGGDHTLSAVVADADAPAAVRALHEAFAARRLRAHVVVVGTGRLGGRVLGLLASEGDRLRAAGLNLCLVGVVDSRRLAWDDAGLDPDALASAPDAGLDALTERLATAHLERLVVVDATASPDVAARHAEWLALGVAVVTPNKAATARPAAAWASAHAAARDGEAPYLYDAAVGAGLGVVSRLRDLVRTGDTVHAVEGVLSGTVAFVMSRLREGVAFSAAVREAREAGYAEPDVRDDLSGRDVARKLALLARELGVPADAEAAPIESLVPDGLATVPLEVFWDRLPEADPAWAARVADASGDLQLVARLSADGAIRVAVETVASGSPLAGLRGPARTGATPLVVRGPGASADVTSAVVLADIVRAAEAMR